MTSDAHTGAGKDGGATTPRPPEPGSVHVLLGGRKTRVVLTGEVDAELGPDLLEAAAEAEDAGRPIEVDVQHVTFMDSTGVAFLAKLASRAADTLVLIRPPELVRFLIEVTSIGDLLRVVDVDPGIDASVPGDDTDDDSGDSGDNRPGPPDIVA